MRFLVDENLPLSFVVLFQELGHNAFHVKNLTELRGQSDEVIFEYAASNGLIIVTRDLNFGNPLRFDLSKMAGMVILRFPNDISIGHIKKSVVEAVAVLTTEQWKNLVVIEPGSIRIRKIK